MTAAEATKELSKTLAGERVCDNEPIHSISSIQNIGYLLIFDGEDFRVRNVSANIEELLKSPVAEVLNTRVDSILAPALSTLIQKEMRGLPPGQNGRQLYAPPEPPYPHLDAYLYRVGDMFGLELERHHADDGNMLSTDGLLKDYWAKTKNVHSVEELSDITCRAIRKITNLDRVMVYKFLPPEMHGEVIAEDKVIHSASYLRHRFPASDIPRPARQLYLRNQTRLVANVHAPTVPIEPNVNPDTKRPLDLSDSRLRAVPEVHLEYLRNMGVQASFSVAVTIADELWGLICCHHLQPVHMSQAQRSLCEIVGHAFALQATRIETLAEANRELEFQGRLRRVFEDLRDSRDPLNELFKRHRAIEDIFSTTGLALISGDRCDMAGLTLPSRKMIELAKLCRQTMNEQNKNTMFTRHLRDYGPDWEKYKDLACGVLAVQIPMDDSVLLMFRPETVKTVIWGGDPRKQLAKREFGGTINPRASFESWEEIVRGESNEWQSHEVDGAIFLRDFIFDGLVKKEKQIQELYLRGQKS